MTLSDRSGRAAWGLVGLTLVLLLARPPQSVAAASDCRQNGGQMTCSGPRVGPYSYGECYETQHFCGISRAHCQCFSDGDEPTCPSACTGKLVGEAGWDQGVICFSQRVHNACEVSPNWGSWLAPGQSLSSGLCWGDSVTPIYKNGIEVTNFKQARPRGKVWVGESCSSPVQDFIVHTAIRTRKLECAPGSSEVNLPGGVVECRRVKPDRCSRTNNPILLPTGGRELVQDDYLGGGPLPLRFARYYATHGFYAPFPGQETQSPMGEYWRHTYERRVYAGTTASVLATAHRHDGDVKDFDANGIELGGCEVSQDRIEPLTDTAGAPSGWRYVSSRNDEVETYDASGRLLSMADRAGLEVTLTYSDAATPTSVAPGPGFLIAVTDPFGRQLDFAYSAFGRIVGVTVPGGLQYTYGYDEEMAGRPPGHLTSVTYPDGRTRRYHYELALAANRQHFLTGITDENGERFATYTYDGAGRAVVTEHAGGANRQEVHYPSSADVATVRTYVEAGKYSDRTSSYAFVNGLYRHLNSISTTPCPECGPRSQQFDTLTGMLTSRWDWNGNRTCYTHDTRGLEVERVEGLPQSAACPAGGALPGEARRITTEWHPRWRRPARIAEPKRITTFVYHGDGKARCGATGALCSRSVQATTDLSGAQDFGASPVGKPRTWTYTYAANGQIRTHNGPRTDVVDVTTYSYFRDNDPDLGKRGQLATIRNALGHTTRITAYNVHGQPLRIVDGNGLVTSLAYDERQRLTSRTVGNEETTFDYDDAGQLARVTSPDGSFLEYDYDAAHRLEEVRDNLGNRVVYTLDGMGNRTEERVFDPAGTLRAAHSREYDALSRLVKDIGGSDPAAQVTRYAYDDQGNLKSIDGPLPGPPNDLTQLSYDSFNRLRTLTDAQAGMTRFAYDRLDQLTSVTDPRDNTTTYDVNGLGDQVGETSPDRGTRQVLVDAAGNPVARTDARGITANATYDKLNRLVSLKFSDQTPSIVLTYDGIAGNPGGRGRLTRVRDAQSGSTSFQWTREGRLQARVQGFPNGVKLSARWTYDAAGRRETLTYPSGKVVTWSYDAGGRVEQLALGETPILRAESYYPFGDAELSVLGNGRPRRRERDQDGRVWRQDLDEGSRVLDYDAAGRVRGLLQDPPAAGNESMAHDVLDRLTDWSRPGQSRTYGYDSNGNRTALTVDGTGLVYSVATSGNRLLYASGPGPARNFSYDPAGNVVADGLVGFTHDGRGRLVRVQRGLDIHRYDVNGLGQRVAKSGPSVPSGRVHFFYDGAGRLLGEYGAKGKPIQEYVFWGEDPVAILRDDGLYFVESDHLGAPMRVRDAAGQLVWRWDRMPFAENPPDQTPSGRPFVLHLRLPGQYFDQETGFHYNYFRDFDPQTGNYLRGDPIGLAGGANPYGYANASPWSRRDPLGLWPKEGHDYLIQQEYGDELQPSEIAAMQEGSMMADAGQFQLPAFSFMHSMLSSTMTQERGWAEQQKYVEERLAVARGILCNPLLRARYSRQAYRAIGMALHPSMDSTSPMHTINGNHWRVWRLFRLAGPGERRTLWGFRAETRRGLEEHVEGESIELLPLYEHLTRRRMREVFDPRTFGCDCR